MPKKQKRDKAYYEERLIRDHPGIYADLVDGIYRTVTEAALAAGLKTPRTRLHELQNAWLKAGANERNEFEQWVASQAGSVGAALVPSGTIHSMAVNRRLQPWAKLRITTIIAKRNLKMGDVMAEMGLKRLNASLGSALRSNHRLQPNVLAQIEIWLDKNKHV
ncbi:hypothetical protein RU07_15995 [Agrobacterium tumefaciens]|uniref:Uncharacterized protein n=1 Tax=Agrobacterium tumefaciens TaxID=358 RepID=A0A0D0JZA1_AGRTU|nr:hypothetical protein RU07_15995 [Agrobacterium tumefaciens]